MTRKAGRGKKGSIAAVRRKGKRKAVSANASPQHKALMAAERIESSILLIRGHKIILDKDLARMYGVTTGNLNKAVSRNVERFPEDFMFRLKPEEFKNLKFQFGISSWGGTRNPPRAFSEHGVAMLSRVLRSRRAVRVNIEIMRAFVRLRQMLSAHADLARRLDELEKKYDAQFRVVFDAIRELMTPLPAPPGKRIGFQSE